VLTLAQEEAERSHHAYIGTEHLLLGLLREGDGIAARTLANLGIQIGAVRQTLESVLGRNERSTIQQIIPTSRVKKVIEISFEEARRLGHNFVGTEHILIALMLEGEGIAAKVLTEMGATEAKVRSEIERLLVSTEPEQQAPMQERRSHRVGQRILVHDPDPPHRLWEGRVTGVHDLEVDVHIAGRPGAEDVRSTFDAVHPIPMLWTRDCPLCRAD
jgi:ATP-dependent Clp protease ATP-binding subunit ClpC